MGIWCGDTPLMPFLTLKGNGQRVVRGVLIKSIKKYGGGNKRC